MKILIVVAVVVVIVGLFFYNERKRSDALDKVAQQVNFSFKKGQQDIPDWLAKSDFYLFSQGRAQILNLMQGQRADYQVAVMGYFYDAPEGAEGRRETAALDTDHQMENRGQTVVWLSRDGAALADFDLSPKDSPKHLAASHAGLQSMSFDGQDAFRKNYVLLGRDNHALRALFSDEVIQMLMAQKDIYMEGRGNQYLCYRHDVRLAAEDTMAFVDECVALLGRMNSTTMH